MTVLVAYASAHASTAGIAQQIADRLLKSGLAAVARPVNQIASLQAYQAVVLGSAVHNQHWLPDAVAFLDQFTDQLGKLPVWLFSTCSVVDTSSFFGIRETIHFRDHRYFAGAFERGGWSVLGDLFLKVCGGSPGDQRDWRDINDWTSGIARELQGMDHEKERRRLHLSVRGRP